MSDQLIDGMLKALNTNEEKLLAHLRTLRVSERDGAETTERSSLLRAKSKDEQLTVPDSLSIANTKRKSVYSRKLRPQSSIGVVQGDMKLVPCLSVDTEEDEAEEDEPKTAGTDSTDLTEPNSAATSPFTSRESTPSRGSPTRSPSHKLLKAKSQSQDSIKLGDLDTPLDVTAPKLEHLAKDRPKPPRTRAVTRIRPTTDHTHNTGIDPQQEDIGDFFETKEVSKEVIRSPSSASSGKTLLSSPSHEKDDSKQDKKKGWSPFSGKSEGKGLGSLFSGKKSQSVRTPEPAAKKLSLPQKMPRESAPTPSSEVKEQRSYHSSEDELEKKSEDEKEEEPEPEPVKRVIPGVRPGFGGLGGSSMMAELQAKRQSMIPLGSKNAKPEPKAPSPANGNKSGTSLTSSSSVKIPPGGRPLLPPGGLPAKKDGEEPKPKPAPLRPRPPLVPPKPSKDRKSVSPAAPRKSDVSSTIISTSTTPTTTTSTPSGGSTPSDTNSDMKGPNKAGMARRMSEAVDETDKSPAQKPEISSDMQGVKKRLSVREKAAALDKNRNECENAKVTASREGSSGDGPKKTEISAKIGRDSSNSPAPSSTADGDNTSSRKSPAEKESQSNGSGQQGEGKEEFLMYL